MLHVDIRAALGHTRWATQGTVKDNANNHPVVEDGIMLVHNGVISNDRELFRLFGDDYQPKAEVDSQVAAALLANPGIIYAKHVTDVLSLIEGSAAFAWLDMDEPDVLHLARCAERPLTIGWTRRGDLVMSSTPETLEDLAMWSNVRIRKVREVKEGTYLRVVAGEITEETPFTVKRKTFSSYTGWKTSTAKTTGTTAVAEKKPTETKLAATKPTDDEVDDWYNDDAYFKRFFADRADQDPYDDDIVDAEIVGEHNPDRWDLEDEVIDAILALHPTYDRGMLYDLATIYDLVSSPWLDDDSDLDWDNLVMWRPPT